MQDAHAEVLGKRVLMKCVSRGVVVTKWPGLQKVPSSILGKTHFFLLFVSVFSFPLRLVFFLVIVVLFFLLYSLSFLNL